MQLAPRTRSKSVVNSCPEKLGLPDAMCPAVCTVLCCLISNYRWDFMSILPLCPLGVSGWPGSWIIYHWHLAYFSLFRLMGLEARYNCLMLHELFLLFFKFFMCKSEVRGNIGRRGRHVKILSLQWTAVYALTLSHPLPPKSSWKEYGATHRTRRKLMD